VNQVDRHLNLTLFLIWFN